MTNQMSSDLLICAHYCASIFAKLSMRWARLFPSSSQLWCPLFFFLSPQHRVEAGTEPMSGPSLSPEASTIRGHGEQALSRGRYKCLELSKKNHPENQTGEMLMGTDSNLRGSVPSVEALQCCHKLLTVFLVVKFPTVFQEQLTWECSLSRRCGL